jgi:hypothetical protein
MPFPRLQGRWLDQAGFAIGANVRVSVEAVGCDRSSGYSRSCEALE